MPDIQLKVFALLLLSYHRPPQGGAVAYPAATHGSLRRKRAFCFFHLIGLNHTHTGLVVLYRRDYYCFLRIGHNIHIYRFVYNSVHTAIRKAHAEFRAGLFWKVS